MPRSKLSPLAGLVVALLPVFTAPLAAGPGVPPSRVSAPIAPHVESWHNMVARDQKLADQAAAKLPQKPLPRWKMELRRLPPGSPRPPAPNEPPDAPAEPPLQAASAAPAAGFAFPGITREDQILETQTASIPPDTMGAAGPDHFVEMLNGSVAIFDKATGQRLSHVAINSFFASRFFDTDYPREDTTDPRVLFDRRSGRWLACILETGTNNHAILAVSVTGDPTGDWCKYLIQFGYPDAVTDYDTLGADDNGVYLGARLFRSAEDSAASIAAIEKGPLLDGAPGPVFFFEDITNMFSTPQPAHNLDPVPANGPAWFVASWPYTITGFDSANLTYRTLVWTNKLGTNTPTMLPETRIFSPAFVAPFSAPALGSATDVDTGNIALLMAVVRKNRLWTCRNVGVNAAGGALNANRTGCEWIQLALNGRTATLAQRGRVFDRSAQDPRFYYFPSINVNGQGHAVMAFSGSKVTEHIGAWSVSRLAGDPLNTMRAPVQLKAGEFPYTKLDGESRNRWGDYSYTSLDPNDDMTLWTIQAYAANTPMFFDVWGTWIAQILAPSPALNRITASAKQGQTNVVLTLTGARFFDPGTNFPNRLQVRLDGDSADHIEAYTVTYLHSTQVRVRFDMPRSVTPGLYDIVLTNPDGQSATNRAAFNVLPAAEVAVTLDADPGPSTVGVPFSYLITVANLGPSEAVNVRLTNTLPPNVCFLSASPPEICRRSGNTVFCELGGLASESTSEIRVQVVPLRAGTLTARASATTTTFEFNKVNNRASLTNTVATNGLPATPQVFISDASAREGHSGVASAVFNVCLVPASRQTVRFRFATADSSAVAGEDYFATAGLLVFTPGQTVKTILVRVKGDREMEAHETFFIGLETPTNAQLVRVSGAGTILDDDTPPVATPLVGATVGAGHWTLTAITLTGADVRLSFASVVGRRYCVEWSGGLGGAAVWQPVTGADTVTGTGGLVPILDTNAAGHPQRFYRVRSF